MQKTLVLLLSLLLAAPAFAGCGTACLGMNMTRADFMKIVRAYVDCSTENNRPETGEPSWR